MPTTTQETPTREELVARAAALVPQLEANAIELENARRLDDQTIAALREAGLHKMSMPKRFGGYEADIPTQVAVLKELGMGDGSVAWAAGLYTACSWLVGRMSEAVQQEVWGSGDEPFVCGSTGSIGTAVKVDGGYLLTGSWGFSSGCAYAKWATIGVMTTTESGEILGGLAVADTSQLPIKDTWFVSGMCGTGSNTMVGKDVFVPDHMVDFNSGTGDLSRWRQTPFADEALYATAFVPTGSAIVAGPVLGMAAAALEYVIRKAPSKGVSDTMYQSHVDAPTAQIGIARAATAIRAAQLMVDAASADIMSYAERGEEMPEVERTARRLDLTWAGKTAREAVDELVSVSGASSFALSNPLQRILRNISVATRHSYLNHAIAEEIHGKKLLGNEQPVATVV